MDYDKAILSNSIITPDCTLSGVILIKNGFIVDIVDQNIIPKEEIIDRTDYTILPGLIDSHVHVNEPGRTEWEGFETATKAALAGGITSIIDMPLNCKPVTVSRKALMTKQQEMTDKLYTKVGFHGGVIPGSQDNLEELSEAGVFAFKIFLIDSGIDEFPELDIDQLDEVMAKLSDLNQPLMVHAELYSDVEINGEPEKYHTYLNSRPRRWENQAIDILLEKSEQNRSATHIIHLSSTDRLTQIQEAKQIGVPVTVETCPHYLFFSAEEIPDGATEFKCAPPIRDHQNKENLWKAILDGVIDFIASDHSPSPPDLKSRKEGNFMDAWGGISSLQFSFSAVWTEAQKRSVSINKIVELMSSKPAEFLGLHQYGKIAPGYVADLSVVDLEEEFTVSRSMIHHRHKLTPYSGNTLRGIIKEVYLDGMRVYQQKPLKFSDPRGSIIRRTKRS